VNSFPVRFVLRALLASPNKRLALRALRQSFVAHDGPPPPEALRQSLRQGYEWLCLAQDVTRTGGVAGGYHLGRGWSAPYPETTGYLIETLLTLGAVLGEPAAYERAQRMADWEVEVQLESGGVRSGLLEGPGVPAVFNTGQVIFGWLSAYRHFGAARYAAAVRRAADWLVAVQGGDGAWREHLSALTTSRVQAYNVRAAWGLARAGRLLGESTWVEAARRNAEWVLREQTADGWFDNNTFAPGEDPLLHTIGYLLEGLLGVGESLGDPRFTQAAARGAEPLRDHRSRGRLAGRYDRNWTPTVSWRCLTGEAQLAVVFLRLAKLVETPPSFREAGRLLLEDVVGAQDLHAAWPELCGAVGGSLPIWGAYHSLEYPNWPVKFLLDGLLLLLHDVDVSDRHAPRLPGVEA
jgi:Squalene-hopene cyclase C-terminal domain